MEQRWILAADRLPADDGVYLVYARSGDPERPLCVTAHYRQDDGWLVSPVWADVISHWMPLPDPPRIGRPGRRPAGN